MEIWAKAPMRIGLAGGATDLPSYSDTYGGSILNATISKYVHVRILSKQDNLVSFKSYDTDEFVEYKTGELPLDKMPLFCASYNLMCKKAGNIFPSIQIESFSDTPVGSGLGTSSTLCVALIASLANLFDIELPPIEIANVAYIVERDICGFSGGKQDQYASAFGGFNEITINKDGTVNVEKLHISPNFISELETHILLYFSGKSRFSSKIIDDQENKIKNFKLQTSDALHEIKKEVKLLRKSIENSDIKSFSKSIARSWESKKQTSPMVSNVDLNSIIENVINLGAWSAKVSGAGGGGFIMLVLPLNKRNLILKCLNIDEHSLQSCVFESSGVLCWRR
ncbi:MAG: hypothetical protein CMD13_00155 [Flavobacteriales bacterium]|nr:hypothetical protein [Flavobacteriales bacterium]|tara:strand:+ start:106 stop:1122 length:1017 start_codon:yes stop_codon:yes gene_type:complete